MNQKNKIEDNIYLIQQHQSREGSGIGEDDDEEDDVDEEDGDDDEDDNDAQWFRKAENRDVSTRPLVCSQCSLTLSRACGQVIHAEKSGYFEP